MRKCAGFTMVELVVVVGILGILSVTAVPLFRTYQQRAYGSEASLMLKRILDAQIIYFLEKNKFYPEFGQSDIAIYHNSSPSAPAVTETKNALNIAIPVGHFLDYYITSMSEEELMVRISSFGNSFPLFRDGSSEIIGVLNKDGKIEIL